MAVIRITTNVILKELLSQSHRLRFPSSSSSPSVRLSLPALGGAALKFTRRDFSSTQIRCAASDDKKASARLSQVQQLLKEAEEKERENRTWGTIQYALAKLQAIIDAASYVPPPPSEEQKKKIAKLAAIGEQKRLKSKKVLSDNKTFRRSGNSWD